jgi:hypothetical protein
MTTLKDQIRYSADVARKQPGLLGLRPWRVYLATEVWTGERPGLGTRTLATTELTVADGYAPRVTLISQRDVIASNGLYQDQDLRVGPLTKSYTVDATTGGMSASAFDPSVGATPTQVLFKVTGDDLPVTGAIYQKVSQEIISAHSYSLILRKTAETP